MIGEHIDYALFGVLPAAVERDILIACAPRMPTVDDHGAVSAHNQHPKYTTQTFKPTRKPPIPAGPTDEQVHVEEWRLDIDKKELRWESYVKAGYYVRLCFRLRRDVVHYSCCDRACLTITSRREKK